MLGIIEKYGVDAGRAFRVAILVGVLSTFGCTQMQTLEELERTAELTGDWSAVHERERVLARRASRKPPRCPPGLVSYCEKYAGSQRGTCINRNVMQSVFVRR